MPTVNVRVGNIVKRHHSLLGGGISEFLEELPRSVVRAGISSTTVDVSLEVHHDEYGLDVHVVPLKVTVYVELNDESRLHCQKWLTELVGETEDALDRLMVSMYMVEYFEVALIIGGHYFGMLCQRAVGQGSRDLTFRCDEELTMENRERHLAARSGQST